MEGPPERSRAAAMARLWTIVKIAALRPWPWLVTAGLAALVVYIANALSTATFGCIGCPRVVRPNPYNGALFVYLVIASAFPSFALLVFWPVHKRLPDRDAENLSFGKRLIDRFLAHLGSIIVLAIAATITWLAYFVYAGLVTGSYEPLGNLLPLVTLTLLLGLSFQFLLDLTNSAVKAWGPAVIIAYSILSAPWSVFQWARFLPLGLIGFVVYGPAVAFEAAIATYGGNYSFLDATLALAIFLGWFGVISACWMASVWRRPTLV
jgi:hypothetical protein